MLKLTEFLLIFNIVLGVEGATHFQRVAVLFKNFRCKNNLLHYVSVLRTFVHHRRYFIFALEEILFKSNRCDYLE